MRTSKEINKAFNSWFLCDLVDSLEKVKSWIRYCKDGQKILTRTIKIEYFDDAFKCAEKTLKHKCNLLYADLLKCAKIINNGKCPRNIGSLLDTSIVFTIVNYCDIINKNFSPIYNKTKKSRAPENIDYWKPCSIRGINYYSYTLDVLRQLTMSSWSFLNEYNN